MKQLEKDIALLLYQSYVASVKFNFDKGLCRGLPISSFFSHMKEHNIGHMMVQQSDNNGVIEPRLLKHINDLGRQTEVPYSLPELMHSLLKQNSFWLFGYYNNDIIEGQHRFMSLTMMYLMGLITTKTRILAIDKANSSRYSMLLPINITKDMVKKMIQDGPSPKSLQSVKRLLYYYQQEYDIINFENQQYYLIEDVNPTDLLFSYHQVILPILRQMGFLNKDAPYPFIEFDYTSNKQAALEQLQQYNIIIGG